jgi:hypothetical protein
MANKTIKAAIEGSIANPKAAKAVIDAVDSSAAQGELAELDAAADVDDIADPGTATAEDCADKINELLESLRDAGILA